MSLKAKRDREIEELRELEKRLLALGTENTTSMIISKRCGSFT
jgi:hypothetical protein